jgi:excisionase family DNA binding protein
VKGYAGKQSNFLREEHMEYEALLNVGQVARMLGLSVATVRKWVLTRYIPYRKIGKAVRFSATEIRDWTLSKSVAPPEGRQGRIDTNEIGEGKNDGN